MFVKTNLFSWKDATRTSCLIFSSTAFFHRILCLKLHDANYCGTKKFLSKNMTWKCFFLLFSIMITNNFYALNQPVWMQRYNQTSLKAAAGKKRPQHVRHDKARQGLDARSSHHQRLKLCERRSEEVEDRGLSRRNRSSSKNFRKKGCRMACLKL